MRRTTPIPHSALRAGRSSAGLGLFARTPIEPGMYIEYVGNRITADEANRLAKPRYLFEVNSRWVIDGSPRYNLARYINHSCKPNCEAINVGGKIYIKALTPIRAGEELTYDYGEEYVDEYIKPSGCRCAVHHRPETTR